jgi:uncharacterized protein (TIGR03435 family)
VLVLPIVLGLAHAIQVHAQATADNPAKDIAGTWQGTLQVPPYLKPGRDLRVVFKISKTDDGAYKGFGYSIDQSGGARGPIPAYKVTLKGTTVIISVPFDGVTYEGKLAADGGTILGNVATSWGVTLPLNLTRATAETEWTLPPPPPRLPPMNPNATPSFKVTINPSNPASTPGGIYFVQGNLLRGTNITLNYLISFAYEVHPKLIIGTPPWAETDEFGIEAKPESEGAPSEKQWQDMLQKLLADRFKLAFHREKKDLPVYALSVGKTGPKLTNSGGDSNGLPALEFGAQGTLHATKATMAEFTQSMQAVVLDRPVVDRTGLKGRFDFDLNWTPDDTQYTGIEARRIRHSADAPPLYTAIQEQIGLKLDATKAPVELLVIDHVEKPSAK